MINKFWNLTLAYGAGFLCLRAISFLLLPLYTNLFTAFTRPIEFHILTGASWLVIGVALTTIIFNQSAAIIGLLVLSIADSTAAIIGMKFGKTQIFNKSLEGTLAFFLTASFIIFLLSSEIFIINICAILGATIVELFSSSRFNDNLFIPITTALILSSGKFI